MIQRFLLRSRQGRWLKQTFEFFLEPGQPPAAIHQALVATGPGWMRCRIDIERERIAFGAVSGVGDVLRAIGHDDLDLVVVRMQICVFFHRIQPFNRH